MALKDDLIAFIQAQLIPEGETVEIDENTSLIELGIIDSMGLLQIMEFIDEKLGVRIPDDEIAPNNFHSVTAIDALVKRLQKK